MSAKQQRVPINRSGYLVVVKTSEGFRSYGVTDSEALADFIHQLTEREIETFLRDERGLPKIPDVTINHPFYIWGH